MSLDSGIIDLEISDTVMTSQERNKFRARRSKHTQSLKRSFKKISVSHAQLAMPFARLHSQMVCTQSEPAEIPQHMFIQILVQVGGDRKLRTSRTTLRTPTPLVISHCFLVYCTRT